MLMPSIFGENLFDDFMYDFFGPSGRGAHCGRPDRPAKGEVGKCERPERNARPFGFAAPMVSVMKTDIKETDNGFELDIDLPGYKKEDVKAELKDGYLTITASRNENKDEKDSEGRYVRRERFTGTASRSFYVGEDITEEDVKAKFEDGILKLSVPKKEPKPEEEVKKMITIE